MDTRWTLGVAVALIGCGPMRTGPELPPQQAPEVLTASAEAEAEDPAADASTVAGVAWEAVEDLAATGPVQGQVTVAWRGATTPEEPERVRFLHAVVEAEGGRQLVGLGRASHCAWGADPQEPYEVHGEGGPQVVEPLLTATCHPTDEEMAEFESSVVVKVVRGAEGRWLVVAPYQHDFDDLGAPLLRLPLAHEATVQARPPERWQAPVITAGWHLEGGMLALVVGAEATPLQQVGACDGWGRPPWHRFPTTLSAIRCRGEDGELRTIYAAFGQGDVVVVGSAPWEAEGDEVLTEIALQGWPVIRVAELPETFDEDVE